MQLTCPHCGFSKQIAPEQIAPNATRVHCPRCKKAFPLERVTAAGAGEAVPPAMETPAPLVTGSPALDAPDRIPKAGFWIRLVAALIDAFLVFWLQFGLGLLLVLAGLSSSGHEGGNAAPLTMLVELFTWVVGIAYYVVFTGHGGQTPGKMAVRVRVIRRDGRSVSYGRAFLREVPGKFISAVILGIGYLMIAFDEQKQGLHDRMADTYVIKL